MPSNNHSVDTVRQRRERVACRKTQHGHHVVDILTQTRKRIICLLRLGERVVGGLMQCGNLRVDGLAGNGQCGSKVRRSWYAFALKTDAGLAVIMLTDGIRSSVRAVLLRSVRAGRVGTVSSNPTSRVVSKSVSDMFKPYRRRGRRAGPSCL